MFSGYEARKKYDLIEIVGFGISYVRKNRLEDIKIKWKIPGLYIRLAFFILPVFFFFLQVEQKEHLNSVIGHYSLHYVLMFYLFQNKYLYHLFEKVIC